ncbi:DNA processing protein [Gelidibacter sediminis]|uniref:DNA processing protein n=1 Tax=Gelidibacter sediminis TaxID=1608710 RepID=A0A4R7Q9B5_9FLAO|nr:DNA-processing protein DprA [Gelidibacter sediminis]TDU43582.1 DNA processing protein [Gelidibacter sediminis]
MSDQDLIFLLALQNMPKIGDITAKKLIAHCGSAEAVLKEKKQLLLRIDGIGTSMLQEVYNKRHLIAAEQELRFIRDHNVLPLYFMDSNYPEKLKHCIDGPILLFQSGTVDLKRKRLISIVGTRMITSSGVAFCERLIEQLAVFKPVIISGFAYGTDITAQKAAMKHNLQTVGCLAHGLNQVYPKVHKRYVAEIEKYGGFLTEFWSTSNPERENFLKRNRIIAGISEATIVIESADRGGSLVTADIANSYNRDVFAVPGRTTDAQSSGCNDLIKYQKAHLLSNPMDVPYILNWELENEKKPAIQKQLFVELEADEKIIYNFLKSKEQQLLDSIALECNMPIFKVAGVLLNMELKGVVRPLPGKLFEAI